MALATCNHLHTSLKACRRQSCWRQRPLILHNLPQRITRPLPHAAPLRALSHPAVLTSLDPHSPRQPASLITHRACSFLCLISVRYHNPCPPSLPTSLAHRPACPPPQVWTWMSTSSSSTCVRLGAYKGIATGGAAAAAAAAAAPGFVSLLLQPTTSQPPHHTCS